MAIERQARPDCNNNLLKLLIIAIMLPAGPSSLSQGQERATIKAFVRT
jgi:hypothetical protein